MWSNLNDNALNGAVGCATWVAVGSSLRRKLLHVGNGQAGYSDELKKLGLGNLGFKFKFKFKFRVLEARRGEVVSGL